MARHVVQAVRARGSLALDPKGGEDANLPERFCAWDEDRTTLAIDAASHLPRAPQAAAEDADEPLGIRRAPVAFVGPGIDLETVRIALDVGTVHHASDPMSVAKSVSGPALAIGCPDDHTAIAALVDVGDGPDPDKPRDVSPAPRMVSAMRAHQELRLVPPSEPIPDTPMGAYVPWGTWSEDLPARLRLVAQRCQHCGRTLFPPRGACPACRGTAFADVDLPREAQLYTMTRIGRGGAPSEFALEQAQVGAYWLGVVEWPGHGVRVIARLSGFEDEPPRIGQPMRPIVRRLFAQEGKTRYGVKFARQV